MKVILLTDIPKVGQSGDVKDVKNGYALNFLIPNGLAKHVSKDEVKNAGKEKAKNISSKKAHEKELAGVLKSLDGMEVLIKEKANDKGHLFAQVHRDEIISAIKDQHGAELDSGVVDMEHPIKEIGESEVALFSDNTKSKIKLIVSAK